MSSPSPSYYAHLRRANTSLTPYLQLRHKLSLAWVAVPIISLLFIVFRIYLSEVSSRNALNTAKNDLLSSCRAAEHAATGAASMPRYMAEATNRQIVEAVNGTLTGARVTMILALTMLEGIINFVVDIYKSTFLCLLQLVIQGSVSLLLTATQAWNSLIRDQATNISNSVSNSISSANSAFQNAVRGFPIHVPSIDPPDLSGLTNFQFPTTFQDRLAEINSSIPSIGQLKDVVTGLLDTPLELLKKEINDSFRGYAFNATVLPVPAVNEITFCGDANIAVIDELARDLSKAALFGVIAVAACALGLFVGNCFFQMYRWRALLRQLVRQRAVWQADPNPSDANLLRLKSHFDQPLLMRIIDWFAHRFGWSATTYVHVMWFCNYIFYAPALACFTIGLFGLLSVELQLFMIGPLAALYKERSSAAISDFTNLVATSINNNMRNQSSSYANTVNGHVNTLQTGINDSLFGWVNATTTAINGTVAGFYQEVQNLVHAAFGGTILETPAQGLIQCFIGSKVEAIEKAVTFLHDNLHVDLPTVSPDVLLISNSSVHEVSNSIATAANGGNNGDGNSVIQRIINQYIESLEKERLFFLMFIGLWVLVVIMGACIVLYHTLRKGEQPADEPLSPEKPPVEFLELKPFKSPVKLPEPTIDLLGDDDIEVPKSRRLRWFDKRPQLPKLAISMPNFDYNWSVSPKLPDWSGRIKALPPLPPLPALPALPPLPDGGALKKIAKPVGLAADQLMEAAARRKGWLRLGGGDEDMPPPHQLITTTRLKSTDEPNDPSLDPFEGPFDTPFDDNHAVKNNDDLEFLRDPVGFSHHQNSENL